MVIQQQLFAAGLVAFYNKVSIGHVEAGLRTYDKYFTISRGNEPSDD